MSAKKVALIILDGWGKGKGDAADAIAKAKTPYIDSLYHKFPNGELLTDGEHVGLPEGQMGNSEVGHLNIGAGRVVFQDLQRINNAVSDGTFYQNATILTALETAKQRNCKLHFIGLVSDGGIHSHENHLHALCDLAEEKGLKKVFIHAFTDGRDTDPKSGLSFLNKLQQHINNTSAKIATVIGRYFAMDRDNRWERVAQAYHLMCSAKGTQVNSVVNAMEASYAKGVTDEFIQPMVVDPSGTIDENDVVICFNFRTDRCREITVALTQKAFTEEQMQPLNLHYCTMTKYDASFKDIHIAYDKDNLRNTLGEIISKANKTQVRIAETEKYPHVTFFFSGGREALFEGEKRLMVNSPKVATYDLQPEMSALEVRDTICNEMDASQPDFICLNFANPDMVGHTGDFDAVCKALETVDACTQKVVTTGLKYDYAFIIIADHGNADKMMNADGSPNTAHTTNPVPIFLINTDKTAIRNGRLADVAPTILDLMDIPQAQEMNGKSLI